MVNYVDGALDGIFAALADPTRREMVARLAEGPATVGELGEPFGITKPAVTKHVKVLERAGLLERRRDGRVHRCRLNPEALEEAEAWIDHHRRFWEASLDRLARYVEKTKRPRKPKGERE